MLEESIAGNASFSTVTSTLVVVCEFGIIGPPPDPPLLPPLLLLYPPIGDGVGVGDGAGGNRILNPYQ